jgi:ABC-type transport system involved in multi-copper enzyme maturation permease subunit
MTPSPVSQLLALAAESFRDAVRRRVAAALLALSLLSLFAVESCTSCGSGTVMINGAEVDGSRIFGWTGIVLYALLSLWTVAISAALAADHLDQALSDGTAQLVLARPVGRGAFALARLAGALGVSLGAGAVLLGGSAAFLHTRYGLELGPAAAAAGSAALGAVAVASLAMTASLFLPRLATLAGAFVAVALISGVNAASLAGLELSPGWAALDRFAPPLGSGIALAVAEWSGRELAGSPALVTARLALWAAFGPALLAFCFRRKEV